MESPLFSYRKAYTLIHRIPASVKIFFQFIICIFIFAGFNSKKTEMLCLTVCGILIFTAFFLAKIPIRNLKKLRFVFLIGGLYTIFKIFAPYELESLSFEKFKIISKDENQQIVLFSVIAFFPEKLPASLLYAFRFFLSVLSAFILFYSTSPVEIKFAFETAQEYIGKIFPPVKKLNPAAVIILAVNFIPQIFSTWKKIDLAVKARTNGKGRKNFFTFIRILYVELTALLSCLINQAETKRKAFVNRSGRITITQANK